VGLIVALYMATIGITGSVLVFRQEFDALALPRHWRELRTTSPANAGAVIARLNAVYPDLRILSLMAPTSFNPTFVATLLGRGRISVACDPTTGEVLGPAAVRRVADRCAPGTRNVTDPRNRSRVEWRWGGLSAGACRDRVGELVAWCPQLAAGTQSGLPARLAPDQF
jgi:hypothetical protein